MSRRNRFITALLAMVAITVLLACVTTGAMAAPKVLVVPDNTTMTIGQTTNLNKLVIGHGANLVAPTGKSLTLTVNGVETGQAMADLSGATPNFGVTSGVNTAFVPRTYLGNIVLTVTDANVVPYSAGGPPGQAPPPPLLFPFRQALYLDSTGVIASKSVLATAIGQKPSGFSIKNLQISSTGQCFDAVFVAGGKYNLRNIKINLVGNGRSDFVGYGSAVVATGQGTTLVLDKARIQNRGVVRAGVVANNGANVVVKNSYIQTRGGVLPLDYISTIDTTVMRDCPWMLGCYGTVRATNLLGGNGSTMGPDAAPGTIRTRASYINSYIGSDGWGILSTDGCSWPILSAIDSTIATTGRTGGYGSYAIGKATEYFCGCTFKVGTYATIEKGANVVVFDNSSRANVAKLNQTIPLGLTQKELNALPVKPTVVNSANFGVKWHGDGGEVDVLGGTVFNTAYSCFLSKQQDAVIKVEGSGGAKLRPGNGVILELIDNDDVGPNFANMTNTNVYHEQTSAPTPDNTWDSTSTADSMQATFSNITLKGNFYNSVGWAGNTPVSTHGAEKNLVLTFNNANVTGVISATKAHHQYKGVDYPTISASTYYALGHMVNTPNAVVNSGVIVTLSKTHWTVSGTSYLSELAVSADSTITAPAGHAVTMTIDGASKNIVPGTTYTGNICLTLN